MHQLKNPKNRPLKIESPRKHSKKFTVKGHYLPRLSDETITSSPYIPRKHTDFSTPSSRLSPDRLCHLLHLDSRDI